MGLHLRVCLDLYQYRTLSFGKRTLVRPGTLGGRDVLRLSLLVEVGVIPVEGQQLLMGAGLNNTTVFEDDDAIEVEEGEDAVGDDDGGLLLKILI